MMHIDRSEKYFIIVTLVLLVIFAAVVLISGFAFSIQVPTLVDQVDPRTVDTDPNSPWSLPAEERVQELAPNKYRVYVLAQVWKFSPGSTFYGEDPITVPAGSEVTFVATSKDIQHGFKLEGTNINMMVLPGQISQLTATFDEPGEYNIICHEYCGINHHTMFATLIVE